MSGLSAKASERYPLEPETLMVRIEELSESRGNEFEALVGMGPLVRYWGSWLSSRSCLSKHSGPLSCTWWCGPLWRDGANEASLVWVQVALVYADVKIILSPMATQS